MAPKRKPIAPSVSDEAVQRATGRAWNDWFRRLDQAGAERLTHPEIVAVVRKDPAVSAWWAQMITVTYEKARALRDDHEMTDGFQVGRTRTVAVPLAKLWRAWARSDQRAKWLADPGVGVRKSTTEKTLRLDWVDGSSRLNVGFAAKGAEKSTVTVHHRQLKDKRTADRMKRYWGEQLDRLKEWLER